MMFSPIENANDQEDLLSSTTGANASAFPVSEPVVTNPTLSAESKNETRNYQPYLPYIYIYMFISYSFSVPCRPTYHYSTTVTIVTTGHALL
jgi:hypothetical protein